MSETVISWYFSWIQFPFVFNFRRSIAMSFELHHQHIKQVVFNHFKYGRQLPVDVAWISEMPSFIKTDQPYRLNFYDITLIKAGKGHFWLDTQRYRVTPGTVFFTSPGQVRRWQVTDLEAVCLFFPADFLIAFFNDHEFLHRLRFFHNDGETLSLKINKQRQDSLMERLGAMHTEFQDLQHDSEHLLRAIAYEVLVKINRWFARRTGQKLEPANNHIITRFRSLLERHHPEQHSASFYADALNITPGHLNHLCLQHLGRSTGKIVRARIMAEACRLLAHTHRDVGQIGLDLGFDDPAYFSRSFKRDMGLSPSHYRVQALNHLGF